MSNALSTVTRGSMKKVSPGRSQDRLPGAPRAPGPPAGHYGHPSCFSVPGLVEVPPHPHPQHHNQTPRPGGPVLSPLNWKHSCPAVHPVTLDGGFPRQLQPWGGFPCWAPLTDTARKSSRSRVLPSASPPSSISEALSHSASEPPLLFAPQVFPPDEIEQVSNKDDMKTSLRKVVKEVGTRHWRRA